MTQIVAIYPAADVDLFNNIDQSVSFVTLDNIYKNINNETHLIVIKDSDNQELVKSIRDAYILLDIICVNEGSAADSRTIVCPESELKENIAIKFAENTTLFNNSELQQAVDMVKKVNTDIIFHTGIGYLGEVAIEYINNKEPIFNFDMSQTDESHLITQVSNMITQRDGEFRCFYLHKFDSLLTLISTMKWFSQNKNPYTRAVFCITESEWLDNIPDELFDKYYILQIPPLWERPKDILSLIDSYDYKHLPKEFIQFIFNYNFPENEQELLTILTRCYDADKQSFDIKKL